MTGKFQINKFRSLLAVAFLFLTLSSFFTSNANSQWKTQFSADTIYNYHAVEFINVYTGYIAGNNGTIFKTTNGGYNWIQQLSNSYQNNFQRIQFPQPTPPATNTTTGYIVGYVDNATTSSIIQETINGGSIWLPVWLRNNYYIKDLQFINAYIGYIVGGHDSLSSTGTILKTTNGGIGTGLTISSEQSFDFGIFKAISFVSSTVGYVSATDSSKNTTIMKTFNSGDDWFVRSYLPNIDIRQMHFINEATGFAVGGGYNGGGAKILKTIDSARTWTVQTLPGAYYFNGISFVFDRGRYRGWACGENGSVYNTTDLGSTWYKQVTPFLSPNIPTLHGISFVDLDHGWAVGNSGSLITTYTGGDSVSEVHVISNNIPDQYKIYQNYPNPFNPETKIKFSVPSASLVKVTVYNSLGQIIKELVNSNLSAGEYETDFNASNLSSGIYFYTLSSASYFKTMKMLLVK